MNKEQIKAEILDLQQTQGYKRTFDFVQRIVVKANTADSVTIPINNAGEFVQLGYNIMCTKNSTVTPDGGSPVPFCGVKIMFQSQAANNKQSNDYIPVQLIASPCFAENPRYGSRPFVYVYPKGDALVISYDNRAPKALNGETYTMRDEVLDICLNGKLYVVD